jgi:hypothetical protein
MEIVICGDRYPIINFCQKASMNAMLCIAVYAPVGGEFIWMAAKIGKQCLFSLRAYIFRQKRVIIGLKKNTSLHFM